MPDQVGHDEGIAGQAGNDGKGVGHDGEIAGRAGNDGEGWDARSEPGMTRKDLGMTVMLENKTKYLHKSYHANCCYH